MYSSAFLRMARYATDFLLCAASDKRRVRILTKIVVVTVLIVVINTNNRFANKSQFNHGAFIRFDGVGKEIEPVDGAGEGRVIEVTAHVGHGAVKLDPFGGVVISATNSVSSESNLRS